MLDLTLPVICIHGNSDRSFPVAKFKTCSLPLLVLKQGRIHHAPPHIFMYRVPPWCLWVLLSLGNWVSRFSWAAWSSAFMRHLSPKAWERDHIFKAKETKLRSLGWEDPLEEEMATHSSILAWEIPWTEEPGGLQSMRRSQTRLSTHESCVPESVS